MLCQDIWESVRLGNRASRGTLRVGLTQSLSILGQGRGSGWIACITDSLRVQSILTNQTTEFTHFPLISWEYEGAQRELPPWKRMIRPTGTGLTPSVSEYLLTDGQAMVVDRRTERYLHNYMRSWIACLHLGEHCSNTTHDSLQTTQDRQSMCLDKHRVGHGFEIGNVAFLRVQPLRPSPWRRGGTETMRSCLFGLFRVVREMER
jgi:hypothetical protein